MALRMRHWVGLALAGSAAVAIRLLPPSAEEFTFPAPPQDVVYERVLHEDVGLANARLQRIRLAETIIPATLEHEGPLAFIAPANAVPQEVEAARSQALVEAAEALRGGAHVALGLAYFDVRQGGYPGAGVRLGSEAEYYFGERGGRTYCVAALPVWRRASGDTVRLAGGTSAARLGVCQAVARYGLPGEAVRRWLALGGAALAYTLTPSTPAGVTFATRFGSGFQRQGTLGIPRPDHMQGFLTLAQEQCVAGVEEGCATLFLEPSSPASPRSSYGLSSPVGLLGTTPLSAALVNTFLEPADRHVLADLTAEFGEEHVRHWWTADGEPGAAFRDAFGVEPGAWYAARTARLVKIVEPGPGVALHGIVGVMALLALATLAGGAWAIRRTVA